ncbi:DUF397 domain-containing protein [Actinomadura sp. LD22]|uniref:DUF397 domain-containing protein n=1 Tax=Actinomadura physcomitrii TaxID=2650748 RepID=A0A6I4M9R0_9ACTN|nr:Scr1 family TA system antitoxin-like transcriptional regulator [Actinomadura physcomitrii]MWA00807.1 DUF397 domain-containing protein [Actinomadura physcomitrii]
MAPASDANPSVHQEVFVSELCARREAAKLSRNKLAAALGCTPQWLAKVEKFEKPPSEGLADDLDTRFQTGGMFRRIWERHVEARKRCLIPSAVRPLVEAEKEAHQINIFEPLLVTGLLQTEEYARFVFSSGTRLRRDQVHCSISGGVRRADPYDHGGHVSTFDRSSLRWRKSSRSGSEGGTCVEVASWRKSSRSDSEGGACVEVAGVAVAVALRDSKDPGGPLLALGCGAFRVLVSDIRAGRYDR